MLWNNRQLAAQRMQYPGRTSRQVPTSSGFARVFPDTFFVTDRAPYFEPKAAPSGRLLTAGFHLMQGYFRDDAPLYELVLDDADRRELDALWYELDFVASVPMRQYRDFIFFERAEPPRFMQEARFDFARVEDKDSTSEVKMTRLRAAYLEKARKFGADDRAARGDPGLFHDDVRPDPSGRAATGSPRSRAISRRSRSSPNGPTAGRCRAERDELLAFYRESRERAG